MRKDDLNIMANIKIIEELKAELLGFIADFYKELTKGGNIAKETLLNSLASTMIVLYILGDRLGFSYKALDEKMKNKLKKDLDVSNIQKEGQDFTRLINHLEERS
ncbi:MAG TPA: MazG-like family protein [Clostridiaceae bacterium]